MNNPTIANSVDRCGVLRSSFSGKWYDMECVGADAHDIICQREATVQDLVINFEFTDIYGSLLVID